MLELQGRLEQYVRTRIPVVLWGPPGVGKTATVLALGARLGLLVETVIASIHEPSDFNGLPVVHDGGVRFAPPAWAVRLHQAGRGILFFDEISNAPPVVQAAMLRVVLERVVGDLKLPDGVAVLAAANPPDVAADGWNLKPPLANRLAHISFRLDAAQWAAEFPTYWGSPPQVAGVEESVWLRARALVAGFIRSRPHLLLQMPKSEEQAGYAWPSPRSWDHASRLLAVVLQQNLPTEEALPFVAETVGEGAGTEFVHWLRHTDLPDPEYLLRDPKGLRLPKEGDKQYAVLSAVVAVVVSRNTLERWQAAWRVLAQAASLGVDDIAGAVALQLARAAKPNYIPPDEIRAFLPLLQRANIVQVGR
jgi:hypothetical protein